MSRDVPNCDSSVCAAACAEVGHPGGSFCNGPSTCVCRKGIVLVPVCELLLALLRALGAD